ncbi:MAG: radical SAM protein [Candidatus Omnitrophica bacterium]|nr:radical SAM protein [Candidatus Omnitrophota bacterium]
MNILLINPPIYDFAAYDLWLKPWGLLKISAILKKAGCNVFFVDALDRHHSSIKETIEVRPDGTGHFLSSIVKLPEVYKNVPRRYKRYGISKENLIASFPDVKIDHVLVSSGMTYWYYGVKEVIGLVKERYDNVPVILGGVYASLCYEHAKKETGADVVLKNSELNDLSKILGIAADFSPKEILSTIIDYDWYPNTEYGVIRLSLGCPFKCVYCAQHLLSPSFMQKTMEDAINEFTYLYNKGIRIFAFYDDALFVNTEYIKTFLKKAEKISDVPLRFYTPNGLHVKYIDEELASIMKRTGFKRPVLSLETVDPIKENKWHDKVNRGDFIAAVNNLKNAGYSAKDIMVYMLYGAPGSSLEEITKAVEFLHDLGVNISLCEYSPVPGTIMAESMNLTEDPLLQNNSTYEHLFLGSHSERQEIIDVKNYVKNLNAKLS